MHAKILFKLVHGRRGVTTHSHLAWCSADMQANTIPMPECTHDPRKLQLCSADLAASVKALAHLHGKLNAQVRCGAR